ncbi:hypothetical protein AB0D99_31670 [Streptomyces sp. NPDC047971]|uniref:hypothetical protein n=1 Tax=Streptomyces sp. NPDC047971 TaxID=3154499 RepID=UPI0033EAC320
MIRRTSLALSAASLMLLVGCSGSQDTAETPPTSTSAGAAQAPTGADSNGTAKCADRPGPADADRQYGEGIHRVPEDMCPGTYSTLGAVNASAGRCSIANDSAHPNAKVKSRYVPAGEMATFEVELVDEQIKISGNCEPWLRVE